jgi:hypothetical protein
MATSADTRVDYVRKAQDCELQCKLQERFSLKNAVDELPKCVKLSLDADIQQAQGVAIVVGISALLGKSKIEGLGT